MVSSVCPDGCSINHNYHKTASRKIFSVGCLRVSSLLSLPVNEPGSPSTVLSSKIIHLKLPGPFTHPTCSRSFPSSHFSSPLADLLITLCKQKYIKINNPEYYLSLTIDPFSIQRRVPVSPANKIFLNKLVKTFPVFLSVFLHVGQSS
ncbi:hypothetical protein ATANTOWER_009377 [Ataeniobius toweri]|uniref:Uncharacterized protein n=1 Tax=Ataeniobius toweri TaxID=208326 RepID=A0ABU7BNN7_9TELE|nr:hypothetical protein [Ataeniobius toweri]